LSLRFGEDQTRPQRLPLPSLPTKELQRVVAEMIG
jgi:hypothetical protein